VRISFLCPVKNFYSAGITKLVVRFTGSVKMRTVVLENKPKDIVVSKDIIKVYSFLDFYVCRLPCRYKYAM
jgi:ABC-type molybdate transport system substrate-binding protein